MAGMVVAPQPRAVEEGVGVLREGGNAVDAALTAALVQGVIDFQMCGLGGFGTFQVFLADSARHEVIDFHGTAGSRVSPDMWRDLFLGDARPDQGYWIEGLLNDVGYGAITTPGTLAGFQEIWRRYGTRSWKELFGPAIRLAAEGFPVTAELRSFWVREESTPARADGYHRLTWTPEARRVYTRGGEVYRQGETLVQLDLARTLERVADEGSDLFYRGEIAEQIDRDFEANGGYVTAEDLAAYQAVHGEPVRVTYRGYEVLSSPPPGGGVTVLQVLKILEAYDLAALGHNSADYIYLVARAMGAAFADRAREMGDPRFVEVPVDDMLSDERAARWRRRLDSGDPIEVAKLAVEAPTTTHVSVLDRRGNAVAMTHSLGSSAGVVTPGLGFMFNNCMNSFDPIPGGPNDIRPGKARITGMAPTIVTRQGRPHLILGAPGGPRIMNGVLQTILNSLDFAMTPVEAVSAARFDCQGEHVDLENRITLEVEDELSRRGLRTERHHAAYEPYFSLVQLIRVEGDRARGGADPRRGGLALEA